jgi:hypothetical protein
MKLFVRFANYSDTAVNSWIYPALVAPEDSPPLKEDPILMFYSPIEPINSIFLREWWFSSGEVGFVSLDLKDPTKCFFAWLQVKHAHLQAYLQACINYICFPSAYVPPIQNSNRVAAVYREPFPLEDVDTTDS